MIIYFAHPHGADFLPPLFAALRKSTLHNEHQLTIPHETSDELFDSKTFFKTCDLLIAEVSLPKLGVGIELGWADMLGVPIICIHTKETEPAQSLAAVTSTVIPYADVADAITQLEHYVAIQKTVD